MFCQITHTRFKLNIHVTLNLPLIIFVIIFFGISTLIIYLLQKNNVKKSVIIEREKKYTKTINSLHQSIGMHSTQNEIFQSMVQILGETFNVDRTLIYEVNLYNFFATAICEWKKNEEIASTKASYSLAIFRNVLKYFLNHKNFLVSHKDDIHPLLLMDNAIDMVHHKMKNQTLIWYPFYFQPNQFYLLIFNNVTNKREWKEHETKFFETVSNQIIVALQKAKLIKEIEEREGRLIWEQDIANAGPVVIFRFQIKRKNWQMEYVSKNIETEFGYKSINFTDGLLTLGDIIFREDKYRITKNTFLNIQNNKSNSFAHEYRMKDSSGKLRWAYAFNRIIRNDYGIATHFHGYVYDITKRKTAEDLLANEKEKLQVTLNSIADAVITTDIKGKIDFMNPVAEILTGWTNEEAQGESCKNIFKLIDANTKKQITNPIELSLKTGKMSPTEESTLLIKKNGNEIPIQNSAAPIRDKSGNTVGAIIVFHDVIQTKKLEWHATHDTLTGIFNRKEFENQIELTIKKSIGEESEHSLLYIDLDQFKIINDTCGHEAGDKLLQKLSLQLKEFTKSNDILSRLGGDEFGLLLKNTNIVHAIEIAEKIRSFIKAGKFNWNNQNYEITASIGIVTIDKFNNGISQILGSADIACYTAKDLGRNRIHVFDSTDEHTMQKHGEMKWVSRINHAFEGNRFILMKQKIQSTNKSDNLEHYEILIRLKEKNGSIVTPDKFIPAAEKYNLMYDIDKWVINSTFSHINNRQETDNILYCINLSGKTLSESGLLDFILSQVEIFKIKPENICFEITETSAIENFNRTKQLMNALKKKGFYFALDDFGSGVSSFGYLKNLPVDFIKIDGSFIKDMLNNPLDLAMVESINQIGHVMNLKTIAEYVESDLLIEKITEMGIDYLQGYAINHPELLNEHIILK